MNKPLQNTYLAASTAPTVEFVRHPRPDYDGVPWSQWGGALFASNGRFYSAIGDHIGEDGNSYLYEYDPITKQLKAVGDANTATSHVPGAWGHGKIHSQINQGDDGFIYMATYWGSRRGMKFDENHKGSVLLRYPINTVAARSSVPTTLIEVSPSSLAQTLRSGLAATQVLTVSNLGAGDVTWSLSEEPDVDWLGETPTSDTLAVGGSEEVVVTFDASSLEPGSYETDVNFGYGAANESALVVPVTLTVVAGECGDQNDDGLVDILDIIIDLQIAVRLIEPTPAQKILSDLNRDGAINVFDVVLALQHIVGLTELLECVFRTPN